MLARDPSMFISKNKKEWENAIAKMFGLADRKLFFKTLKKLTKYNASKAKQNSTLHLISDLGRGGRDGSS